MDNLITITVEFTPATNCRCSRVRIGFSLGSKAKFIPYQYETRDSEDTAIKFLASKGLHPIARTCLSPKRVGLLFPFDSFTALQSALS